MTARVRSPLLPRRCSSRAAPCGGSGLRGLGTPTSSRLLVTLRDMYPLYGHSPCFARLLNGHVKPPVTDPADAACWLALLVHGPLVLARGPCEKLGPASGQRSAGMRVVAVAERR